MDAHFIRIAAGNALQANAIRQLMESGFVILSGAVLAERLAEISATYDKVMSSGAGSDFKIGSTTTRRYFVDRVLDFEEIYQCPALLEASARVIGGPFKLSSLLGRTLRAGSPVQDLHADIARDCPDAPMAAFILMLDPFQPDNGATRFVPGSQNWPDLPSDRLKDSRLECAGQVVAYGDAGSMIVFNGAVWHGHTANLSSKGRRSIQGYFVRRRANSGAAFASRLLPETRTQISSLTRYLLGF